ncbi:lysophospholipid acyltransferase family protein [Thiocystis violacea]|uniref:lysophospholipid acyltransferase family protein n=1 Tax=Thiocystis violacea TaxID=13725 RepID=UPI0019076931|nr:lysophospholipid acyltransferase family protein [Thiocystis violacea]MBK1721742.1 1-acyl-sn-glycerol-3-phosphate acyltransferase [Thiocystis violacea]
MRLRSLYRSLRVLEHLITGAVIAAYVSLGERTGARPAWLPRTVRWWHARLCHALGIQIRVQGQVAPGCLLVGNHVSWLDIPVLGAQSEIGFLSKADVRRWPLIGWMAEIAGTRFIERGAHQADRVLADLRRDLAQGRTLMIFPEGTTTDGSSVKRFHPRLFGIVQSAALGIQPIAISYHRADDPGPDTRVAYVGEDRLIANLWRVLRHPDLVVSVRFLPPIWPMEEEQRRRMAERARHMIVESLGVLPAAIAEPRPASARDASDSAPIVLDPNAA